MRQILKQGDIVPTRSVFGIVEHMDHVRLPAMYQLRLAVELDAVDWWGE